MEKRDMLYYLGYSSDEQVESPALREAIVKFDELVVPQIYGAEKVDRYFHGKADMAKQLVVVAMEAGVGEPFLVDLIGRAREDLAEYLRCATMDVELAEETCPTA
jgi:hypothetical protein